MMMFVAVFGVFVACSVSGNSDVLHSSLEV
jgi:hypothetical protein